MYSISTVFTYLVFGEFEWLVIPFTNTVLTRYIVALSFLPLIFFVRQSLQFVLHKLEWQLRVSFEGDHVSRGTMYCVSTVSIILETSEPVSIEKTDGATKCCAALCIRDLNFHKLLDFTTCYCQIADSARFPLQMEYSQEHPFMKHKFQFLAYILGYIHYASPDHGKDPMAMC